MRAQTGLSFAYHRPVAARQPKLGWKRAGLTSFAYRLAHLDAPRTFVVWVLASAIYLF